MGFPWIFMGLTGAFYEACSGFTGVVLWAEVGRAGFGFWMVLPLFEWVTKSLTWCAGHNERQAGTR